MDKVFRLLIVGSRGFNDYELMKEIISESLPEWVDDPSKLEIISGGAKGADTLAEKFADDNMCYFKLFKADWDKYGKAAGPIRNKRMQEYISKFKNRLCIAFWDGKSKGTKTNFKMAKDFNNPIIIYDYIKCQYLKVI